MQEFEQLGADGRPQELIDLGEAGRQGACDDAPCFAAQLLPLLNSVPAGTRLYAFASGDPRFQPYMEVIESLTFMGRFRAE